jgi:cytidylate kinase
MVKKPIIAIDGPAATGKSVVAQKVAQKLGFLYIDTGAMYRVVTLAVMEGGVSPQDFEACFKVAQNTNFSFKKGDKEVRVFLNGQEVTNEIRKPEVSQNSIYIAKNPFIRKYLVKLQREMAQGGGVVMEGRDIGTVVFPDAEIKIYFEASLEERVRRRQRQLAEKGIIKTAAEVKEELLKRDLADTTRKVAPLRKTPESYVIDTTNLTVEEQVEKVLEIVKGKNALSNS